jgi:predicted membrane protein DUF2142
LAISKYRTVALPGVRIRLAFRPVAAFVALSLLFGTLIILATPPLRGPDETAHFLRAYGVAQGDLVPSIRDAQGRKGILLPPRLYDGFEFFESVRIKEKPAGFGYGPVFKRYFSRPEAAMAPDAPATFVPYAGSEGYSPIAYLPQAAAALVARLLDLEFVSTLYLMRFAGLASLSALIAVAIAMVPPLAWSLTAIALLPAALYGRSVVSADGSALATAMLVTVLWLRGIVSAHSYTPGRHAFWLVLSALTKPTNVAFVLLTPLGDRPGRWRLFALTTIPAIAVALLWVMSSGADTAAWRMVELTGQAPLAFDPAARIIYLLGDPLHFPAAVIGSVAEKDPGELWRQLIGVLGLFDTVLQPWVYPAVTALLFGTFFIRLPLASAARARVAVLAAIAALAYAAAVYAVCYLSFTPLDADAVWGVQGRYFVPILPLAAIVIAASVDRAPDERLTAALAIAVAVLSGGASIEAILRADWSY